MTDNPTQQAARACLDALADLRRACEGKPRKGGEKPRNPEQAWADMFGEDDVPAWLGGLFSRSAEGQPSAERR